MAELHISFDEDAVVNAVSRILKRKTGIALSLDNQLDVAGEYAMAISKYVPYKTGKLLRSADVVPHGEGVAVSYSAMSKGKQKIDYAPIQYEIPFANRSTPGTYDHWNRHLTTAERQEFYERCAEIISKSMQDG